MPKIMKMRLHLPKIYRKHRRLFLSGHGAVEKVI